MEYQNEFLLAGYLTANVDVKTTKTNKPYCSLIVEVDNGYTKDGKHLERKASYTCTYFGNHCEQLGKGKKGDFINLSCKVFPNGKFTNFNIEKFEIKDVELFG